MLAIQQICDRPGLFDAQQALERVLSYVTPIQGTDNVALHEATGRVNVLPFEFPAPAHRNIEINSGLVDRIVDEPIFQPLLERPAAPAVPDSPAGFLESGRG